MTDPKDHKHAEEWAVGASSNYDIRRFANAGDAAFNGYDIDLGNGEYARHADKHFCPTCQCRAEEWWKYCAECGQKQ